MALNKNFVVKNGLEVYNDLILANALSNRVGIGSTTPRAKLDVRGGIAATDIVISGYSTVTNTFHVGNEGSVFTALGIGGSVGIGTALPAYLLDIRSPVSTGQTALYVKGDVRITGDLFVDDISFDDASLTNLTVSNQTTTQFLNVTGISTFGGAISVGGSIGASGQYLRSTGAGVTWGTFPVLRTSLSATATSGQTGFSTTYNVGFVDVFVNGVRLNSSEFTATDGSNITLLTPCFGGEIVDILAYSTISTGSGSGSIGGGSGESYWVSTTSGIHTLSNVGIGTTNPRFKLEVGAVGASGTSLWVNGDARIVGVLTVGSSSVTIDGSTNRITVGSGVTIEGSTGQIKASTFVGDGSGLIGVVGSGSGVIITDSGSLVGTAGTINFGDNLTVSPISAGIVTVTATGGGGESYWVSTTAGIHTLSNVGIGTTNPTSTLTVKGNTSLETLNVSGVSTFNGTSNFGTTQIISSGEIKLDNLSRIMLGYSGDTPNGLVIRQNSSSNVSEIVNVGGDDIQIQADSGRSVFIGNDNITDNLTVAGYGVTVAGSTLFSKQLSVSGVSTLTSNVSVGGTISVDGGVKLATNNPTIVGTSGTVGEIKRIGGAPFFYDGSAWREFVLSSGTPVSVPADTEWDNVVFRATFDTDFTDAKFSATPVYVSAGSTIVGAAVTIGTGAFRNDGAVGSGVSYAYRSDYDFTGSWTIEFWMYVDSGPSSNNPIQPISLISMHSTTGIGTSGNWSLAMYGDQYANKYITWFNQNHPTYKDGYAIYSQSGAAWSNIIVDKWNHFAFVREADNGSLHFYVNGTEQSNTVGDTIIDNDILDISGNGLHFGGDTQFTVGITTFNVNASADVIFDDVRISAGVGTAGQRYNSIGISTSATFTPPTTALPTTGTLSSYVQPPGDKYGEITLGGSPTWRGTSGVTVSQQSSGNYRVSFASTYTNANDYYVLSQGMDQGFASYVGIARSTTHVDLSINKQSDDTAVNTGSLAVQIKNHI